MIARVVLATMLAAAVILPAAGQKGEARSILVGYYDAKPSCWRNSESKPEGIFIDVAKEAASRLGWKLSFVYDSWDGLLDRLKSNRVDFVPAIVRTPQREAFALFTQESVMTDWGAVYVRRGGSIRSILDLAGKRVGALENDFWFAGSGSLRELASSFGLRPDYRFYADYSSLFAALGKGEIDAAAASNSLGIVWAPLLPIDATSVIYNPIELRFAAPRSSPEGQGLIGELDGAVRELRDREPELLRRILSAYAMPERRVYQTPLWVAALLACLSAVLVAIVAALALQSRALRSSVAQTRAALERLGEARSALETSLGEKELLVHELSHRVKNNLQLVLSLMGMLSECGDDTRDRPLAKLQEKIFAISQAEEELHASGGIGQASMEALASALLARLTIAEGRDAGDFSAAIDLRGRVIAAASVIPVSLVASELLSNACRFGASRDGTLHASLRVETAEDGSGEVEVTDEGPGFPDDFDPEVSAGLGFRLILALASQVQGSVELSRGERARVLLRIPSRAWSSA